MNKTFLESRDKGDRGCYCWLSKPNYCPERKKSTLALIAWVESVVSGLTVPRQYVGPLRNSGFHRGICHFKLLAI